MADNKSLEETKRPGEEKETRKRHELEGDPIVVGGGSGILKEGVFRSFGIHISFKRGEGHYKKDLPTKPRLWQKQNASLTGLTITDDNGSPVEDLPPTNADSTVVLQCARQGYPNHYRTNVTLHAEPMGIDFTGDFVENDDFHCSYLSIAEVLVDGEIVLNSMGRCRIRGD